MKKAKLPNTDSIQKLAAFWDTHDVTDFEDELEEITEPVFVRESAVKVQLHSNEAKAVHRLAKAEGLSPEELIRAWILQQLSRRNGAKTSKRPQATNSRRR